MKERPIPSPAGRPEKNQPTLEVGEGRHGVPPPQGEQSQPQQDKGESQPLPSLLEVLERRVQLQESERAGRPAREKWTRQQKMAFGKKFTEAQRQQGDELKKLYTAGTARDSLIIDVYTTMAKTSADSAIIWTNYISPQKTRDLIARLKPMSNEEIREELRQAKASLERKTAAFRKRSENWWLYRNLTPEERAEKQREARREYGRRRYRERKEQARLQTEQHQTKQVFPPPASEQPPGGPLNPIPSKTGNNPS